VLVLQQAADLRTDIPQMGGVHPAAARCELLQERQRLARKEIHTTQRRATCATLYRPAIMSATPRCYMGYSALCERVSSFLVGSKQLVVEEDETRRPRVLISKGWPKRLDRHWDRSEVRRMIDPTSGQKTDTMHTGRDG
jgi:hypothetical protein